jgi:hypothetical protein
MEDAFRERANRERGHVLDAIARCVEEEDVTGWALAYLLSEYLTRVLYWTYGRDGEGVSAFLHELIERVEDGSWPPTGDVYDQEFRAAMHRFRTSDANGGGRA